MDICLLENMIFHVNLVLLYSMAYRPLITVKKNVDMDSAALNLPEIRNSE